MKKLCVFLSLVIATCGWAGILINWNSPANTFYQKDGVTLLPNQSLFLAFWSPDTTMGINALNPESPTGGDVFLGARNTNPSGSSAGRITGYGAGDLFLESSYGYPTDAFVPGYVYILFFNLPYSAYSGPGSIPNGTFFGAAPLTPFGGPLTDADPPPELPPPLPNTVNYGGLSYIANMQIVPEPTMALLMLCGLGSAVWFRRRRMERGVE